MSSTRSRFTERELHEFVDWMSEAERIAHFGVFRWDVNSGVVRWSDELHRIYGLRPGEFPGTVEAFLSFLHPDDRERIRHEVQRSLRTLEPFIYEERILRADSQQRVLMSRGRPLAGPDGHAVAVVGVCHDVTERVMAERALGLSERRMRAIMDHSPSIIAVKDLNGRYLMSNRETGRVLGLPADEVIGRYCTDLFPSIAEQLRADDRRAAAEMEPVYDEAALMLDGELRQFLTVTFALPDDAGRPVETCTIGTDVTERKERECERRERQDWEIRIASALDDGRMLVYCQPIVELTGAPGCWGRELLVRMREDSQVLGPEMFLPEAELYELVQAIDVWMVAQALRLVSVAPGTVLSVNLSGLTVCDPSARAKIAAMLEADPAAARSLVFEITETANVKHLQAAGEFARELTRLGSEVALDDFGVGFGAFTYLRQLPVSYLKIDRSFTWNLPGSPEDQRMVKGVIGLAHEFGLRVIVEGIENHATLDLVREYGADFGQGMHIGRPAAAAIPSAVA